MTGISLRNWRRAAISCAFAALTLAIASCGGDGNDGEPPQTAGQGGPSRPFMMGFSTVPRELNADAYAATFDLAADNGEMVLIQRTLPWSEFLPGATVGEDTVRTTASEKEAIDRKDLRLFFAIDPTDSATGRGRLAGLPTRDFGDAGVRVAFTSYAEYVALNYKPDYLALGVEMNQYYAKNPEDFARFTSLYGAAYEAVKKASPKTQVTMTFQYEDLQGILPTDETHFADWQLVRSLDPLLDFIAISTYPSFSFEDAGTIPDNYYSQLRAFTSKPIAIAQMGFASMLAPSRAGASAEEEQAAFVRRALDDAETLDMPFVIWFAGWDPSFAEDSAFGAYRHIGLLRDDSSEKPAWRPWAETADRPYQPG